MHYSETNYQNLIFIYLLQLLNHSNDLTSRETCQRKTYSLASRRNLHRKQTLSTGAAGDLRSSILVRKHDSRFTESEQGVKCCNKLEPLFLKREVLPDLEILRLNKRCTNFDLCASHAEDQSSKCPFKSMHSLPTTALLVIKPRDQAAHVEK